MKRKYFVTLALSLASLFFFVETIHAQKLTTGNHPKETNINGFDYSLCVEFSNQLQVCKAANYESGETEYLVQNDNKVLAKTIAPYFSLACCEMKDFHAYYGDLDKNGSNEIIIASLEGVSNGLGVSYFNIHIFQEPLTLQQKPLTFPIQDFGKKGNFIYDKEANETFILVTSWDNYQTLDPNRGWGTYLVGRWFRYRNGTLLPVFEKPMLARRLLYSFAHERNTAQGNGSQLIPYLWLKNKYTHKFFGEPKEQSKPILVINGTVKKYEETFDHPDGNSLFIELDNSEVVTANKIDKFGILPQRFVLPYQFSPLSIYKNIEGKKVRIETFKGEYGDEYSYLWFVENRKSFNLNRSTGRVSKIKRRDKKQT
jgi:hypothetical protein